jgi:hypothetical protein
MSIQTSISPKLQELIDKANHNFESSKDIILAAYNQALTEGFTPKEAKKILYERIRFFHHRTIRRYLPIEAKDTKKIRTRVVDNSPQKRKDETHMDESGESDITKNITIQDLYKVVLQLQNTIKKNEENIGEIPGESHEDQNLKEEMDHSKSPQIRVRVTIPLLFREVQLLKMNNAMYGEILIENGRYVKLESS